jgi:hypothetical protein
VEFRSKLEGVTANERKELRDEETLRGDSSRWRRGEWQGSLPFTTLAFGRRETQHCLFLGCATESFGDRLPIGEEIRGYLSSLGDSPEILGRDARHDLVEAQRRFVPCQHCDRQSLPRGEREHLGEIGVSRVSCVSCVSCVRWKRWCL